MTTSTTHSLPNYGGTFLENLFKQSNVLETIAFVVGPSPATVHSITYDSRKVTTNSCFICIKGQHVDGHQYIDSAIKNGAQVIVGSEKELMMDWYFKRPDRTFVVVHDSKKALASFASAFYQNKHKELALTGITGTNGKTTITAYIRSLVNALGEPTASIGTAGVWDQYGKINVETTTPTTPESSDLYTLFDQLRENKTTHVAMEATSIALEQGRLHGLQFDIAVHSNLRPEHLDFHNTMEHYRNAKLKLFQQANKAVVNLDDAGMSAAIINSFQGELWTYSIEQEATVMAQKLQTQQSGTSFDLIVHGKRYSVMAPIFGEHNVANLLAAVTTCMVKGYAIEEIIRCFPLVKGAPGRFQLLTDYPGRQLIFDFAHSPFAFEKLFHTIKPFSYKRLILLIAGIGVRPSYLRPEIAKAVEGKADEIVVTVDHPGDEDPETVMADVISGFINKPEHLHLVGERGEAIQKALSLADEGDLILITGICMENYQIVKGKRLPYDDLKHIHLFLEQDTKTTST
ncbi:UDP-N-acetylmuramoyl-L-alanyl-D-glutamate--2,6-diaminopimelate ligase [Shouchella lehensis]|uniref:UDP-N-acetylmuramyl-tripeptide synthetase n=1 Tax=Shouchella lehensis TaxID=300825 RepID=A0A4Y7WLS6_9BACI|nr:hypothetical protein [Shouchella lehensis]TES49555.1 UDP-N-acetylmuramoyl-L-alanyl-D-glutamate--2,6-diaminopimelate ligase [Shouchella lehensis]